MKSSDDKESSGKNENHKNRKYSPLEFAAKILKSTKDADVDIASKLPGGTSISKKTQKGDADAQNKMENTDSSGKS